MTTELVRGKLSKILVLNPNSSKAMTDGLKNVIDSIDLPYSTEIYTYTAPPSSPASINNGDDLLLSHSAVLADLSSCNPTGLPYDGVLIACYSVHPLVTAMQLSSAYPKSVTGIFEASILAALSLLGGDDTWGIVTTGKWWEKHLADGVDFMLGSKAGGDPNSRFRGVESTGLNASDFHDGVDPAIVRQKLKEATKRLLSKGGVKVILMGCAGMAGLEAIIRSAASEAQGEEFAYSELHVVDGVRAGITQIDQMIKYQRLLPGRP
ncbi:Asp/Glu/hydantoin racemase [Annulohypoxylon maeteangense]|uniref:Asp/Glu/hydantoin racemase n=1 Tax=Annulohypoxylon maeteangense TaxID=1927788 RepID=UPI002007DEFE|nr:Asp/Glu/hydantoin racemase [Annulohypoxylon maeteangense]KAI0879920.1 Asp/Glu/hydantoin racemase [Annulohypoxylon maeteangense]